MRGNPADVLVRQKSPAFAKGAKYLTTRHYSLREVGMVEIESELRLRTTKRSLPANPQEFQLQPRNRVVRAHLRSAGHQTTEPPGDPGVRGPWWYIGPQRAGNRTGLGTAQETGDWRLFLQRERAVIHNLAASHLGIGTNRDT